jgi:hypothetical protein
MSRKSGLRFSEKDMRKRKVWEIKRVLPLFMIAMI